MNFTTPRRIASPISGQPVEPRLVTRTIAGQEITEAVYTDPASGAFIRKAVVSVKNLKTGKVATTDEQLSHIHEKE